MKSPATERQGDALASLLFTVTLEYSIRNVQVRREKLNEWSRGYQLLVCEEDVLWHFQTNRLLRKI
jgi:hypothetical protein